MADIAIMPEEKRLELQAHFLELLRSVERPGMESLIQWMQEETDFFNAPASGSRHGAFFGGLLCHSLDVYRYLQNFVKPLKEKIPEDTLILCGLLHDLCKINMYVVRTRNVKQPGERRWEEVEYFAIEDSLPFGHGEKSVYLIMKHIPLTDDEALAIRWHMGGYDDAARSYIGGLTQSNAYRAHPLCVALNIADMYCAHLLNS